MQIIGQVYNARYFEGENGKKDRVIFSLGHRKAFPGEKATDKMVFSDCVIYGQDENNKNTGLVKTFNENFVGDEHKGKPVALNGQWDEYDWTPDPSNPDHKPLLQKRPVTATMVEKLGFKLADSNQKETAYVFFAPTYKRHKFVVRGIEFLPERASAGSNTEYSNSQKENQEVLLVADDDNAPGGAKGVDDDTPF